MRLDVGGSSPVAQAFVGAACYSNAGREYRKAGSEYGQIDCGGPVRPPDYTFEPARLDALKRLSVLDSAPERGFDDIVELASQICEAPVALVSLVSSDRQWFKSRT